MARLVLRQRAAALDHVGGREIEEMSLAVRDGKTVSHVTQARSEGNVTSVVLPRSSPANGGMSGSPSRFSHVSHRQAERATWMDR